MMKHLAKRGKISSQKLSKCNSGAASSYCSEWFKSMYHQWLSHSKRQETNNSLSPVQEIKKIILQDFRGSAETQTNHCTFSQTTNSKPEGGAMCNSCIRVRFLTELKLLHWESSYIIVYGANIGETGACGHTLHTLCISWNQYIR